MVYILLKNALSKICAICMKEFEIYVGSNKKCKMNQFTLLESNTNYKFFENV